MLDIDALAAGGGGHPLRNPTTTGTSLTRATPRDHGDGVTGPHLSSGSA